MEWITLTLNVGGLRFVDVNGRQFAVAHATILRPKVLNGSKGSLYYPPEEIAKNYQAWNGRPMVIKHPVRKGQNVSANDPDVFIKQEIGRVYNSTIEKDGSNSVEAWFDVELTKKHDSRIWNALNNKQKIELSTGLYTDNEDAPKGSTCDGVPYDHIARNYRPDHLAILPDEIGACSTNDGCGVFNKSGPHKFSSTHVLLPKDASNKILALGKSIPDDDLADDGRENDPHVTVRYGLHTDNHEDVSKHLANQSPISYKLGKVSVFSGNETGKDYDVIKVDVDSDHLKQLNKQLANLEHTDTFKDYNPHATIAYVKKGLGDKYAAQMGTLNEQCQSDEVVFSNRENTKTVIKLTNSNSPSTLTPTGNDTMRETFIQWLTTNCTCYKSADGKANLDKLTDNELKEVILANAEKAVENDADMTFLSWMSNADKDIKSAFVGMMKNKLKAAAGAVKNDLPFKKPDAPGDTPAPDATGTDPGVDATAEAEKKKKAAMVPAANNQLTKLTEEQFLALMPDSFKEVIANGKKNQEDEKRTLAQKITAHITDNSARQQKINSLMQKSLSDLREYAELMPTNNTQQTNTFASYAGLTGGAADITDNKYLQEEKLEAPVYDWAAMAKVGN